MTRAMLRIRTVDIDNVADIENLLDSEGVDYSIDENNRVSIPEEDIETVEKIFDNASVSYDEV